MEQVPFATVWKFSEFAVSHECDLINVETEYEEVGEGTMACSCY